MECIYANVCVRVIKFDARDGFWPIHSSALYNHELTFFSFIKYNPPRIIPAKTLFSIRNLLYLF